MPVTSRGSSLTSTFIACESAAVTPVHIVIIVIIMRRLTRHVSVTAHKDDESAVQRRKSFNEKAKLFTQLFVHVILPFSSFRSVSVQATGDVRPAVDTAHFTHTLGLYIAVMGVRTWGKWGQLTPLEKW